MTIFDFPDILNYQISYNLYHCFLQDYFGLESLLLHGKDCCHILATFLLSQKVSINFEIVLTVETFWKFTPRLSSMHDEI